MTVLFESCLVYGCDLLTPRKLSSFVVVGMTHCMAPLWGLLGGSQLGRSSPARSELHISGVPLRVIC